MSKTLKKKALGELLELERTFWQEAIGEKEQEALLEKRRPIILSMESESGLGLCIMTDFINSLVRYKGLKPNATLEDLCRALECLGWTVTDDEAAG